jgi:hypothetical protein
MKIAIRLLALIALVMSGGGALPSAQAQVVGAGHVLGNGTASPRTPTDTPIPNILDQYFNTNGFIYRSGALTYGIVGPGTGLAVSGSALNLQPPTISALGGVKSSSAPTGECATGVDTSGNVIYGTSCGGSTAYTQDWCSVSTPNCGTFTPGSTTQLTLINPPATGSGLAIFFNGVRTYGNGISWTLSGSTVTFSQAIPSDITVVEAVSGVSSGGILASNVGFTQAGTGAVTTTLGQRALEGTVYVEDYGVICDGATDNTTTFGSSLAAAVSLSRPLQLCAGTMVVNETAGYSLTGTVTILGYGQLDTTIKNNNATGNMFLWSTTSALYFSGFEYEQTGTPTAGAFLSDSARGTNGGFGSFFTNLKLSNIWDGLKIVNGAGWSFTDSFVLDAYDIGNVIANTTSPDDGSAVIQNVTYVFNQGGVCANTGVAILHESAGALKLSDVEVSCGAVAYSLDVTGSSSVLKISNFSFENQYTASIQMQTSSASYTWANISIDTGEVRPINSGAVPIEITGLAAGAFSNVTIGGLTGGVTTGVPWITVTDTTGISITSNTVSSDGGTQFANYGANVSHCSAANNQLSTFTSSGTCTP